MNIVSSRTNSAFNELLSVAGFDMTCFLKTALFFTLMSTVPYAQMTISPTDPLIRYNGRVDRSLLERVQFDWPGITIEALFQGPSCRVILEGMNCFDGFVDGILKTTFCTGVKKESVEIAAGLTDRAHLLFLVKRSESVASPSIFYGLQLNDGKSLLELPSPPERKMEFIGDSYTAGFSNEYLRQECPPGKEDSIILATTNTNRAFGPIVARAFGAQYQINAISGKGLVRNYNGIDKGLELPAYYGKTLIASANSTDSSSLWDFSKWKADVVVIGIGINDFQGDPPYADSSEFDAAYHSFIEKLRKHYPGVKIICCATKVWPNDNFKSHVRNIVEQQKQKGETGIFYFEYQSENDALYGHPTIYDHTKIARELIPLVAKATGWRRTDMRRGK